jgi:hypothetical protein
MNSIFKSFKINDLKTGKPIDMLATMQIMFDQASLTNKTLWEQSYVDRLFDYRPPQLGLTAEGLMGQYGVRIRASVIGDDADTPLRPGRGFDIWSGEIPRFGHKFQMTVKVLRALLMVYENNRLNPAQKLKEIERTLFSEYKDSYLGCKDVADEIVLKALSGGGIARFDPAIDNPDGRKYEVDCLMPEENKMLVPVEWTEANINSENLDILGYLVKIIYDYRQKGIFFKEIWMAPQVKFWLMRTLNIRLAVLGKDKSLRMVTEPEFQALLSSMSIPPIVEINKRTAYQKDGKVTNLNPWNDDVITLIPHTSDGKIGEVQPAIEDNALMEDPNVNYTDAGNGIRIAKWRTGESTGQQAAEYTQASWRAVPIITAINAIVCVKVRNTNVPFPADGDELPAG